MNIADMLLKCLLCLERLRRDRREGPLQSGAEAGEGEVCKLGEREHPS